jgi:hypothetical protein
MPGPGEELDVVEEGVIPGIPVQPERRSAHDKIEIALRTRKMDLPLSNLEMHS